MHLKKFGLDSEPFAAVFQPAFFYRGHQHGAALSFLERSFAIGAPAVALIGTKGTGKSASLRYGMERRRGGGRLGQIDGLAASPVAFLGDVLAAFGFDAIEAGHAELRNLLSVFVVQARQCGQPVVLQVRDPNMPSPEVAEEILWLMQALGGEEGFQLLFSGSEPLERLLASPRLAPLARQCALRHRLSPLDESETVDYVHFRLAAAGASDAPGVLPDAAARGIHAATGGVVRAINRVAAAALALGAREEAERIEAATVRRAAVELGLVGRAGSGGNEFRLEVRLEETPYTSLPLGGSKILIGRHSHNEINLRDGSVSRYHAMIVPEGNGWVVVDLNSTNGTTVNGEAVQRRPLEDGDRIAVGRFEIEFSGRGDPGLGRAGEPDLRRTVVVGDS
jgi:general secretion pathway protein A